MKFNGNITLNALGQSEVQNFVAERVASNPTFQASEAGRLVYNTTTRLYYMNSGLAWVALSTGGDAASLQTEMDAVESAIGTAVSASGVFNAAAFTGSNIVSATSITDAINQLDAAASGKDALAELVDVVLTAPGAGQFLRYNSATGKWVNDTLVLANVTDVTATAVEVNRLTGVTSNVQTQLNAAGTATAAVASDLASEVTRATTAEAAIASDLGAEVTRATAAEVAIVSDLNAEEAARIAGDSANATAVTTEETRALAAEAVLEAAIEAEALRATDAETDLSDRITQEVSDRTASDNTMSTAISSEVSARQAADAAFQIALDLETATRAAADVQIYLDIEAAVAGLAWENPVDSMVADHTQLEVGSGYRALNTTNKTIYTYDGAAWSVGEALVEGAAFYDKETDVPYTFNGTDLVQFNGASSITAGAGLVKTGNTLFVASTSGTITVTEDSIDVSTAVLSSISDNAAAVAAEAARATLAETGLGDRIDDEIAAREAADVAETAARNAAIAVEVAARIAADVAMQAELDAEEARAAAAEAALDAAIDTEVARALAAEAALATSVTAEQTRAQAAELVLTNAIDAEETRALAAELVLTNAIDAEETRALAAEAALASKLAAGYFLYDGAAATTHTVTHNIGSRFNNVTVIDSATNEQIIPQAVIFDSATQLTVTFNVALACKVVVMGLGV